MIALSTAAVLTACSGDGKNASSQTETDPFNYRVEQFADLEILRYQVPGFEELTLQQKTLLYYLSEAALEGRDILFDQNGKYNLTIRRTLEAVYENYEGDRNSEEFAAFTTDNITTYEEGKQLFWGFREVGDAIFQIRLPVGITGTVYFGLSLIDNHTNLLTYNKDTMQVTGIADDMPGLTIDGSEITLIRSATVATSNSLYPGTAIFDTLLKPGMAIALSGLGSADAWAIRLLDESTKHIEMPNANVFSRFKVRNQETKSDTITFTHSSFSVGSNIPVNNKSGNYVGLGDYGLGNGTYVIYRTLDNKLMLLEYTMLGSVVVALNNKWTLIQDLNVNGYPLDKGMKLVYTQNTAPSALGKELTEPYSVTLEELTNFDPEQTFTADASIKLVEIYGRNSLPTQ